MTTPITHNKDVISDTHISVIPTWPTQFYISSFLRHPSLQNLETQGYWPDQAVFSVVYGPLDQETRIRRVNLDRFWQMWFDLNLNRYFNRNWRILKWRKTESGLLEILEVSVLVDWKIKASLYFNISIVHTHHPLLKDWLVIEGKLQGGTEMLPKTRISSLWGPESQCWHFIQTSIRFIVTTIAGGCSFT